MAHQSPAHRGAYKYEVPDSEVSRPFFHSGPHRENLSLIEENETNVQKEAEKTAIEIENSNRELSTEKGSFSTWIQQGCRIQLQPSESEGMN